MIFPKVSHRCQFETGHVEPLQEGTVKKREMCVIIGLMSAIMRDSA